MEQITDLDKITYLTDSLLLNLTPTVANSTENIGKIPAQEGKFISLLAESKLNLQRTYKTYLVLTIMIFSIMVLTFFGFLCFTIIKGGFTTESYVFGGISLSSFFTALLWKPQSKLLLLSNEISRIAILNATAVALFDMVSNIKNDTNRTDIAKSTLDKVFNSLNRNVPK